MRRIAIDDIVSGDAGCDDPDLIPTAIGFDAPRASTRPSRCGSTCTSSATGTSFEQLRATIDVCARSFVTDAETYETVEQSPFVLAGQGPWAPGVRGRHPRGPRVAAGTGD